MTKRFLRGIAHVCAIAGLCASTGLAADPVITVSAKQRYPWNGLVDLQFTINGDSGTKYDTSFTAKDMVGGTNITMATVRKADGTPANVAKEQLLPGTYNWVWDATADLPKDWKSDRVTVTGKTVEPTHLYMVIDLSGGANASSYPISYLDAIPSGGWSDTYKTTKLVLRRIEPGTFMMGGQYKVTLTKPFYIGVFEVTQKQYMLVTGSNPIQSNWVGYGEKLPVYPDYTNIRGGEKGTLWPLNDQVDANSFMGMMRSRCNQTFDLPTDAQWEYACRGGTTSLYNNGGNTEADLSKLARYYGNKVGNPATPAIPGQYLPNNFGLYDMHGNMFEFVLDWGGALSGNVTDPKGPSTGVDRVKRGGGYFSYADKCTSSYRYYSTLGMLSSEYDFGFRICLTLPN